jgi:hypothetical protein
MSKVVIIDDKKSVDVEVPESIVHLSEVLNMVAQLEKELPSDEMRWDDAYAYLTSYFEKMYCTLNKRDDIDEINAEFVVTSDEDRVRGITMTIDINDFTKA